MIHDCGIHCNSKEELLEPELEVLLKKTQQMSQWMSIGMCSTRAWNSAHFYIHLHLKLIVYLLFIRLRLWHRMVESAKKQRRIKILVSQQM